MGDLLRTFVSTLASVPQDQFYDRLIQKIDDHFDTLTSNTMTGLRHKDKNRQKGIFFELMTLELCQHNAFVRTFPGRLKNVSINPDKVWMFSEIPQELRDEFGFTNQDNGIDLVAQNKEGKWLAIQCKYRKKPRHSHAPNGFRLKWAVTWNDLSTFYALCHRTGPKQSDDTNSNIGSWFRHVVITTATGVSRKVKKNDQDISICQGTFRKISKEIWLEIVGYAGQRLGRETGVSTIENIYDVGSDINNKNNIEKDKVDQADLRKKREAFLSKTLTNITLI